MSIFFTDGQAWREAKMAVAIKWLLLRGENA